jgi:hypothetical protein
MNKQPFIDRSLLIPIGISAFSILGIFIAFLIVYLDKPPAVAADSTATPFKYLLLATETRVPDPDLELTPSEEPTTNPFLGNTPEKGPALPTAASSQASTLISNTLQSSTTTTAGTTTLNVTKRYDDTDPLLDYDGDWVSETSVGNAHQGTLFFSKTIGNDVIFSFTGEQLVIGYLDQPGLGSIAISIDDNEFQLDQSVGQEWVSPQLSNTEHFVIIIHQSGNSVNLDYIAILSSN